MTSFWINVKKVLPYKNLEIKDLAFRSRVPYSTIVNGMNKNSMPHADIAVKIAHVLDVSLESLLGQEELLSPSIDSVTFTAKKSESFYKDYQPLLEILNSQPLEIQEAVKSLIKSLAVR